MDFVHKKSINTGDRVRVETVGLVVDYGTVDSTEGSDQLHVVIDHTGCIATVQAKDAFLEEDGGEDREIKEWPVHFNELTPQEDEVLSMLAEEAAEIIQIIMKTKRHGFGSHHPDNPYDDNRALIAKEVGDFLGVLDHAIDHRMIERDKVQTAADVKMLNAFHYMHHHENPSAPKRELLRENDRIWAAFYRDGMTLGQIAAAWGCRIYNLSPWLTAPLTQAITASVIKPGNEDGTS